MNSFSNVPISLTTMALAHNFAQEEESRRAEMRLNRDYYYDQHEQSIDLVNEDQSPVTINLTKPIISKRSNLLYSNKLVRVFDGPQPSINFISQVYTDNNIDHFLLMADLASEMTGSALITPVFDETKESNIRLKMYDTTEVSVIAKEDDFNIPEVLSIIRVLDRVAEGRIVDKSDSPKVERVIKQQLWTEGAIVEYDGNVLVRSEPNELGFIPFVNFKAMEVHGQYFGHAPARNVRKINQQINRMLTDLSFSIKFQGYSPIAISGMSGDTLVVMHPGRALNLPAGASVQSLSVDPKIEQVLSVIQWLEQKCYETASVPMISVVGGGSATSGRELMIKWYPLLKIFHEKAQRFQKYELELANTILRYAGLDPINNVNVDYRVDDLLPITEAEDTLAFDLKYHIKTPVDELMRRDTNLSEEEAQAIVFANKDINTDLGQVDLNNDETGGHNVG